VNPLDGLSNEKRKEKLMEYKHIAPVETNNQFGYPLSFNTVCSELKITIGLWFYCVSGCKSKYKMIYNENGHITFILENNKHNDEACIILKISEYTKLCGIQPKNKQKRIR